MSAALQVRHPPGYEPERRYALDVVFRELLGIDYTASVEERRDVEVTLADGSSRSRLVLPDSFFQTAGGTWLRDSSLPSRPLRLWQLADEQTGARLVDSALPVVYGDPLSGGGYLQEREGETVLSLDVLGSSFFMLTRYEEIASETRDEHGRFPARASLAAGEGFLERPLVDEYVEVLWSALARLWPRLTRRRREFRLRLSHDVDLPLYGSGRKEAVRLALRALRREHAPWVALRRLAGGYGLASHAPEHDLHNTFGYLMDVDEAAAVSGAFYFITAQTAGAIDGSYSIDDPWIRRLMRSLHERGHEIGLHPSYGTFRDGEQTRREFEALLRACDEEGIAQPLWGGRQHYLRWENPTTWQNWEDAGLAYDSSLTFADRAGFRCGVCHEYPVFNLLARKPMRLRERPLVVMDASLLEYERLPPERAAERVLELKRRCRLFDGEFTLLWHNDRLLSLRARRAYERMLTG
ncbi:MAG: polysaccharide deacetylase family protein [Gaiellaceae bacterium]